MQEKMLGVDLEHVFSVISEVFQLVCCKTHCTLAVQDSRIEIKNAQILNRIKIMFSFVEYFNFYHSGHKGILYLIGLYVQRGNPIHDIQIDRQIDGKMCRYIDEQIDIWISRECSGHSHLERKIDRWIQRVYLSLNHTHLDRQIDQINMVDRGIQDPVHLSLTSPRQIDSYMDRQIDR